VNLSADDGSMPGLVLMSDSDLRAYDRDSPTPLWTVDGVRADSALVLRGRVYASSGRGLVALDARTGEELWRTEAPEGRAMGGLVTDGRHLLSSQQRAGSSDGIWTEDVSSVGELAAYRLDDGVEDWRVDLPDGLTGIWSTGSTLVGWGDGGPAVLG
jgi:outer membrane protein assembly factor BamB